MDLSYGKWDVALNLSVDSRYALRVSFWLLEKIIAGRDLRVGGIVSEFNAMRDFTGRWIMASGLPDPKMLQNLLDEVPLPGLSTLRLKISCEVPAFPGAGLRAKVSGCHF